MKYSLQRKDSQKVNFILKNKLKFLNDRIQKKTQFNKVFLLESKIYYFSLIKNYSLNYCLLGNSFNKKKQKKKNEETAYILYIRSTFRTVHINISTQDGRVKKTFSTGLLGLKKAQRAKVSGLFSLAGKVLKDLKKISPGLNQIDIVLKGFNFKQERVVLFFLKSWIRPFIRSIIDLSDIPYNGCRPKKLRRK